METRNLIGYQYQPENGKKFKAIDPALGVDLPGDFYPASLAEVDAALDLAEKAFSVGDITPITSLDICCTWLYRFTSIKRDIFTVPILATLPRSFR